MGVKLKKIIEPKKAGLEDFRGKKIAVDAYNTIYQFLTTIRQYDGTPLRDSNGRVTSHLSGIFYRNMHLLNSGVKPVYVFDGEPPFFKRRELDRRADIKEEAKKEYQKAVDEEDFETAKLKAAQSVYLTKELVLESKSLLTAMGIPYVQAPSEGEAQAARMVFKGDCYAAASQDYDSLLFGANRVVRNLNITGKRKLPGKNVYIDVNPEIIELQEVLNSLGIDRNQLIIASMLVGTDYCQGISGIGPVKAIKAVKQYKTFENVVKALNWQERSLKLIYDFFKNPNVTDSYKLEFKDFDTDAIKKILVEKHDFSGERIDSVIKKTSQEMSKKTQTSLFKFT